jgi:hypothetical protein
MSDSNEIYKLAQEHLAKRKIQTAPQAEDPVEAAPKAEDPAKTAREAERVAICERWKQVVKSKSIEFTLPLLPEGIRTPLESVLKIERMVITHISLRMKLVYDCEFFGWNGDYADPDVSPNIEVDVSYIGILGDEQKRILDLVGDAISSRIGKPVKLEADDWWDHSDEDILLHCWDPDTRWNIADFLLQHDSGEEVLSDEN